MTETVKAPCVFCGSVIDDKLKYGTLYTRNNITVHSYCLYLSSNLPQKGSDNQGILGFLFSDIEQEIKRASHLNCSYCGKRGASIGCCNRKCSKTFHLVCGLEHGALTQFVGTFNSYCYQHLPNVVNRPQADEKCAICFENLQDDCKPFSPVDMICSPCCHNGWYHKDCLQKYANSAGYFFKCPLCNNSSVFRDVTLWGIFVPERDASWETEPNAFHELLERETVCHAEVCNSVGGRNSIYDQFLYCILCGAQPVHSCCTTSNVYKCNVCNPRITSSSRSFLVRTRHSRHSRNSLTAATDSDGIITVTDSESDKSAILDSYTSDEDDPLDHFEWFVFNDNRGDTSNTNHAVTSPSTTQEMLLNDNNRSTNTPTNNISANQNRQQLQREDNNVSGQQNDQGVQLSNVAENAMTNSQRQVAFDRQRRLLRSASNSYGQLSNVHQSAMRHHHHQETVDSCLPNPGVFFSFLSRNTPTDNRLISLGNPHVQHSSGDGVVMTDRQRQETLDRQRRSSRSGTNQRSRNINRRLSLDRSWIANRTRNRISSYIMPHSDTPANYDCSASTGNNSENSERSKMFAVCSRFSTSTSSYVRQENDASPRPEGENLLNENAVNNINNTITAQVNHSNNGNVMQRSRLPSRQECTPVELNESCIANRTRSRRSMLENTNRPMSLIIEEDEKKQEKKDNNNEKTDDKINENDCIVIDDTIDNADDSDNDNYDEDEDFESDEDTILNMYKRKIRFRQCIIVSSSESETDNETADTVDTSDDVNNNNANSNNNVNGLPNSSRPKNVSAANESCVASRTRRRQTLNTDINTVNKNDNTQTRRLQQQQQQQQQQQKQKQKQRKNSSSNTKSNSSNSNSDNNNEKRNVENLRRSVPTRSSNDGRKQKYRKRRSRHA